LTSLGEKPPASRKAQQNRSLETSGAPPSVARRERLPVIDVLRLWAALGVLLFHAATEVRMPKQTLPPIELFGRTFDRIPSVFTLGATGVSLFFVISGFCLYLSARRKPQSTRDYFVNRAARIYPAYLFALFVSVVVVGLMKVPLTIADVVAKAFFLQGFIQAYNLSINGALWSMASEVQFYLAFPLMALFMMRRGPWVSLAIALPVCLGFRLAVAHLPDAGVVVGGLARGTFLSNLLFGRLVEFTAGMAVASVYLDHRDLLRRWSAYAVLPLMAFGYLARGRDIGWLAEPALGIGYAALLGFAVTWLTRMRSGSPFAVMGRASYSLFLIHIPLLILIMAWVPVSGGGLYTRLAILLAVALPICCGVALAMYSWIELPLWTRLSRGGRQPVPIAP
jgi:peptidoglycan/LPS O-acetylase OafA/YrhL